MERLQILWFIFIVGSVGLIFTREKFTVQKRGSFLSKHKKVKKVD